MAMRETDLYPPIKAFLQSQGYAVKGEVANVDVVACRDGDPPVIVELKLQFGLTLLHQGVARQTLCETVYLAVPHRAGLVALRARKANVALCRRLGLGLLIVRVSDGLVTVLCDPAAYRPRRQPARQGRLLRAFARLEGDPNLGGGTRVGLTTPYRQDALRLAAHLGANGACKGAAVARATGVRQATRMMADNHHGWFVRVAVGLYDLSPDGRRIADAPVDGS